MLVRMLTVHCAVQAAPLHGPLQWWPARAQHRLLSFSPCHLKFSVFSHITTMHNFNFNFKTLTKPCVQSLNQSLALLPSLSSQICNKLLPTRSSSSTSATVTTSTIFELASSQKALYNFKKLYSKRYGVNYFSSSTSITVTTSIKFPKRQSVSEVVTSIANDRTRVR